MFCYLLDKKQSTAVSFLLWGWWVNKINWEFRLWVRHGLGFSVRFLNNWEWGKNDYIGSSGLWGRGRGLGLGQLRTVGPLILVVVSITDSIWHFIFVLIAKRRSFKILPFDDALLLSISIDQLLSTRIVALSSELTFTLSTSHTLSSVFNNKFHTKVLCYRFSCEKLFKLVF